MTNADRGVLVGQFRALSGEWHLAALVRQCFSIRTGKPKLASEAAVPIGEEATFWKPRTDVVVLGHAYGRGARESRVVVEVAGRSRTIRAMGERRLTAASGNRCMWSAAEPFDRVPVVTERAYGGVDRIALASEGDAMAEAAVEMMGADRDEVTRFGYPRNRRGVGFIMAATSEMHVGALIPNLDDPDDPVEPDRLVRQSSFDWLDAPTPAHLGWVDPLAFPRSLFLGLPMGGRPGTRTVREIELGTITTADLSGGPAPTRVEVPVGALSVPVDERFLCGGALGLTNDRLVGGEPLRIAGMSADRHEVALALPGPPAEVALRPPGCDWYQLEPSMNAVIVDMARETLVLVWAVKLRIASRYPEHELALTDTRMKLG